MKYQLLIALLASFSLCAAQRAATADTVEGHVIYYHLYQMDSETGSSLSIFDRGLKEGEPVKHVTVELLRNGNSLGTYITDNTGYFSITTSKKPDTLRVEAINQWVEVKVSKFPPLGTDKPISWDFDFDTVNLNAVPIDDTYNYFIAWDVLYPVSRAFFVAESVYRAANNIQELTGTALQRVWVRLGFPESKGYNYYDRFLKFGHPTIHLICPDAGTIDHEYGHHIENETGAFGLSPGYSKETETDCDPQRTECWDFFEALASWYGGMNSLGYNDGIDGVDFFAAPIDSDGDGCLEQHDYTSTDTDTGTWPALGENWWLENGDCIFPECDHPYETNHSDQVISKIAQFLWDLIDDHEDTDGFEIEGAHMPVKDVLATLSYHLDGTNPCPGADIYNHVVSIDQFIDTYLDYIHPEETLHPDLYSALQFNKIQIPWRLVEYYPPDPVTLSSDSHIKGTWYNNPNVQLTITDGSDDVSGSFYYWLANDTTPDTELDYVYVVNHPPSFHSKETTYDYTYVLAEGDGQWIHAQSEDMAFHLGTDTAHFGPVRIDLTPPDWGPTKFPTGAKPGLIGKYLPFQWEATDALSGVASVSITYKDSTWGVSQTVSNLPASGSYNFYLDPDVVMPTSTGYFEVTVFDNAGNSRMAPDQPMLTIVSPFAGPTDLGLSLDGARVVSGDLNGDGMDEVVISGGGTLRTMQLPAGVTQILAPGLSGGDLFLADTDRDGDLDLVAAGDFGGTSPEIYLFKNDGTGILTSTGPLPVATMPDMVVRVVDLFGTGEPILVYGGKLGGGAVHKELYYYNLVTGAFGFVTGTVFRGGDFEVGDINADGVFDFVIISFNTAGSYSVSYYLGSKAGNDYTWTEHTISGASSGLIGDVDLGNWDSDNDLDLFIMYQKIGAGENKAHTEMWQWTGATFTLNLQALSANSISDGDGHIVDIYNDGRSDVFAMGRPLGGAASSWFVTNDALGRHGTGVPSPVWSTLLYTTDTAWGDFDNDHDLDVVICGTNSAGSQQILWYENVASVVTGPNNDPPSPKNLTTAYDSVLGGYTLGWDAPGVNTDRTPESAFEYEITVGTMPGLSDVVSGAHHAGRGQQVAAQPVSGHFERFVPTTGVIPIYWSVRSVDSGWRRSAPATSY